MYVCVRVCMCRGGRGICDGLSDLGMLYTLSASSIARFVTLNGLHCLSPSLIAGCGIGEDCFACVGDVGLEEGKLKRDRQSGLGWIWSESTRAVIILPLFQHPAVHARPFINIYIYIQVIRSIR